MKVFKSWPKPVRLFTVGILHVVVHMLVLHPPQRWRPDWCSWCIPPPQQWSLRTLEVQLKPKKEEEEEEGSFSVRMTFGLLCAHTCIFPHVLLYIQSR